ncbi:hypothetical protein M758_N017000, partial [Ceratodon purpureus]
TASWDNVADLFREADAHGTLDPDNMEPEESMEMYNHPSRMSPLRLKKRPLLIPGGESGSASGGNDPMEGWNTERINIEGSDTD